MICPGLAVAGTGSSISSRVQQLESRRPLLGVLPDLLIFGANGYSMLLMRVTVKKHLKYKYQQNIMQRALKKKLIGIRMG